jgi:alkylation response protein AidB-like acyl-CoA dehydrogenase
MTGDAEFNEVFLDDVEVPEACLLGALGQGWPITTWMMGRERVSVGLGMRDRRTLGWHDLAAMAKSAGRDAEPAVRHRVAEIYLRQRAIELLGARIAQETDRKIGSPLRASAVKVAEAAAIREAAEFAIELLEDSATVWAPGACEPTRAAQAVLMSPAFAIGGGTDDIQLNTLAERLLGLPRDGAS